MKKDHCNNEGAMSRPLSIIESLAKTAQVVISHGLYTEN